MRDLVNRLRIFITDPVFPIHPEICDEAANEIERLKCGDFTEEEFQNLCHNFTEEDVCRFKKGCEQYQKKLFSKSIERDTYDT